MEIPELDSLFSMDDSDPLMMLVWILPIILFVFYGQRIQLIISAGEIKKGIKKLDSFRLESRDVLINYVNQNLNPISDHEKKLDNFFEYFSVMPVDTDPNGIMQKINHLVRSREDFTRLHVKSLFTDIDSVELSKIITLVEITTTLQTLHKTIRHLFLTAKKQNNYPLIVPLQMMLPFVIEEATALKDAISAIKQGQPLGDGIGPMVVGKLMLGLKKKDAAFETVFAESEYNERKLFLLKAKGPNSTVGRTGDAVESLIEQFSPDLLIMVDAALKFEGEDSAQVAQGFGAAIGGIGTERFKIEEIATKNSIPILAIVVKQSIKEAITLMTKDIAQQSENVNSQIHEMIDTNLKPGQSVLIVGVGNTLGVTQ